MENTKTTRFTELNDLLAFAKENGYNGSVEKLEKVLDQWKPKNNGNKNAELAIKVYEKMEVQTSYTSKDIINLVPNQIKTVSKAAVVMKNLIEEGYVLKAYDGKKVIYTRVI